jgi:hypothetical protein
MDRTQIISEHIVLLKDLGVAPSTAIAQLQNRSRVSDRYTWSDVRTAIERWYINRRQEEIAGTNAERIASEGMPKLIDSEPQDPVVREEIAFREGKSANREGHTDNPYSEHTAEYHAWIQGYQAETEWQEN